MQDYLNEVGEAGIKAIILKGGIKGWHQTYGGQMMEWYDEKAWASKE
jgi:arsenical-resistance protein 2